MSSEEGLLRALVEATVQGGRDVEDLKLLTRARLKADDPLERLVELHYIYFRLNLFHAHYDEWVVRRVRKVLELYEGEFRGAKVLEVGGGLGDVGATFAALGSQVTSLEGRRVNQRMSAIKNRWVSGFNPVLWDVEKDFTHFGKFDFVLNFGILEMVSNVDAVMGWCAKMSDNIFLETMVCDSTDPTTIAFVDMDRTACDNPMGGVSARPSPAYVEAFFEGSGFKVRRCFDADLNTMGGIHRYDWKHSNDPLITHINQEHRRFWYFTKK